MWSAWAAVAREQPRCTPAHGDRMSRRPQQPSTSSHQMHLLAPAPSATYQLTPVWERVVRTRRLPAEVDLIQVFTALKHRLRDPEPPVRQHALRVLVDLIPVVQPLDGQVSHLLPDLLSNLGHPAPAVRQGSLDALTTYLTYSETKHAVLTEICTKCLERTPLNDKTQEDITTSLILALPTLLLTVLRYTENPTQSISIVIKSLSSKLLQVSYQEIAMRSLLKIKEKIGEKEFDSHVENLDPTLAQNFNLLNDVFNGPRQEKEATLTTQESEDIPNENENEMTITVDADNSENVPNGKIILETEFAFDSDTAITMTILEEDFKNSVAAESEDDSFDYTTYNKSLVKVLTDSEHEEYDAMRRTPRRVRFGGEVVKMRTPDSDNVNNSDVEELTDDSSKHDENSENGGSLKRRKSRSLIPLPTIPIKSLPKYRKQQLEPLDLNDKRKSKSLNDISEYCKVYYKSTSISNDDDSPVIKPNYEINHHQLSVQNGIDALSTTPKSPILSPRRMPKKHVKKSMIQRIFPQEDLSSSQSGNSSTGSGSSSDNTLEDFIPEDGHLLDKDVYKDLCRGGDERSVSQALERLNRELNSSTASMAAIEPQLGALAGRLASVGPRGRAGAAAGALLRTIVRGARAPALRSAMPRLATAIAAQTARAPNLVGLLARRMPAQEIVQLLLDPALQHWKSSKMRAGALRVVAHLGNVGAPPGCAGGPIGARAARAAACSCRHPRRRVRAAALDALAALTHLTGPRAVLAALHHEATGRSDADQLYDAVFARLCRNDGDSKKPPPIPKGGAAPHGGLDQQRADLAWVMAGSNSASPPSAHKHERRLENSWPRSAPDLPALVSAGPHANRTSQFTMPVIPRRFDTDKNDKNMNGIIEARVLTAPPAAVTLRPLILQQVPHVPQVQQVHHMQHSVWPRQGLSWPQQPAPPWSNNQNSWSQHQNQYQHQHQHQHQQQQQQQHSAGPWTSFGHTWGSNSAINSTNGGSWPQRRPPPQLRALTPPPNRPRLQPLSSPQTSNNWNNVSVDTNDGSPTPQEYDNRGQLDAARDREGLISRSPQNAEEPRDLHRNQQYKFDELDDSPSHKSGNGSMRDDVSLQNSPISENHWRNSASSKPSTPIKSPPHDLTDEDVVNEGSPYEDQNQSPIITHNDSEEEALTNSEEQRAKTPSTTELRFINDNNQTETIYIEEVNEYNGEERFINLKVESPHSVDDEDVPDVKIKSPAHSTHSHITSSPGKENDNRTLNLTPTITLMGSSVSTDEEVKSIASTSSEMSNVISPKQEDKDEVDKIFDGDIENHEILGSKISPGKKTPKKTNKTVPKILSSKLNRNKVQPSENGPVGTLLPFEKPKEALTRSLTQIESSEWETVMTGLQSMSRLVKCHSSLMETQLTVSARAIASQVKNLRSQVARAACRLAGEMFVTHRKGLESEADELAVPLLHRTADTNKFLRIDANDALDKMCDSITPQKSISILMMRGTVHQNAIVRCTTARLLANITKNSGHDKIFSIQKDLRDRLFQSGADLLTEGSLETRGHAKQLFKVLSQNNHFVKTMREVIPLSKYRNIEKTLNALRTQ